MKKKMYKGVRVELKGTLVNLLQFAYDTLIVCETNLKNIIVIKIILRCFKMASNRRHRYRDESSE